MLQTCKHFSNLCALECAILSMLPIATLVIPMFLSPTLPH